jgi:hypothetical protein
MQILGQIWMQFNTNVFRRKNLDNRLLLALSCIHDNMATPSLIKILPNLVGVSRSRLYELFKDELQSSPNLVWNCALLDSAMKQIVEKQQDLALSLAGFLVFMKALNHYLFEIIQFDPVSQLSKSSVTEYEYYFERVYFDMGAGKFISAQKMPILNSDEAKRAFQNLNLRS